MQNNELFNLKTYLNPDVLAAYTAYQRAALDWWQKPANELSDFGVDQTTVRAMRTGMRGKRGPVAAYEDWAKAQIARVIQDSTLLASLSSREGFETWHQALTASLVTHWSRQVVGNNELLRQSGEPNFVPVEPVLSIAHRYKLVDLFVRYLRVREQEHPELAKASYEFGHIPLDRKSLAVISAAFNHVGLVFSMGNIKTESTYQSYQRLARAICAQAGGTPLLLDVFAWHSPFAQAIYPK